MFAFGLFLFRWRNWFLSIRIYSTRPLLDFSFEFKILFLNPIIYFRFIVILVRSETFTNWTLIEILKNLNILYLKPKKPRKTQKYSKTQQKPRTPNRTRTKTLENPNSFYFYTRNPKNLTRTRTNTQSLRPIHSSQYRYASAFDKLINLFTVKKN